MVWKNAEFVPGPKFHSSDLEVGYKNQLQAVSRAYMVDSLTQRNDLSFQDKSIGILKLCICSKDWDVAGLVLIIISFFKRAEERFSRAMSRH